MRDHAEVSDIVRWPADSEWAWRVDMILATAEGSRLLAISRGETEADVVTRVVRETEVSSNAFQLPDPAPRRPARATAARGIKLPDVR